MAEFGGLDEVWFVISPLNPFKTGTGMLADYHRRELLMRAIGDYPRLRVSSVEFRLPKPSYTIDTMRYLKAEHPEHDFIIIMGSDQLPEFHHWKESEQLLLNWKILVYPRPGYVENRFSHPSVAFVKAPLLEISSSFIRQSISEGKDIRFFLPLMTWEYLDEMNFYR
jgi:nicotinate-nucleotide adenylyltransferase